jgi:YD repeat-containing protein
MFYPNGELVSFVYYYQGELAQIKRNKQTILAHRRFNEHGQVVRKYFGNNTVRNYQYGDWLSTNGAISQIQTGLRSIDNDSSLQNLVYTYDLIGNITELNDNGEILNFGYDDLNRLTSVSGAYQQSYTYDKKTGNLLTKSDVGNNSNYVYSSTSHPHAVTGYGAQSDLFEYDANGQMIKRYGQNITYDGQGQLVSYNGDTHVYDGDGNRVATVLPDGNTRIYIGNYYETLWIPIDDFGPVDPPALTRGQVYKNYLPVIQNGEGADFKTVPGQIY